MQTFMYMQEQFSNGHRGSREDFAPKLISDFKNGQFPYVKQISSRGENKKRSDQFD